MPPIMTAAGINPFFHTAVLALTTDFFLSKKHRTERTPTQIAQSSAFPPQRFQGNNTACHHPGLRIRRLIRPKGMTEQIDFAYPGKVLHRHTQKAGFITTRATKILPYRQYRKIAATMRSQSLSQRTITDEPRCHRMFQPTTGILRPAATHNSPTSLAACRWIANSSKP